jgi:hypothetical protein
MKKSYRPGKFPGFFFFFLVCVSVCVIITWQVTEGRGSMSNQSKRKGSAFEAATANYLAEALQDDRIERRVLQGVADRGDIAGVRLAGKRVVIECKAEKTLKPAEWLREAEAERVNDSASFGVVVAKRKGVGETRMVDQLVLMTLGTFADILKEVRR